MKTITTYTMIYFDIICALIIIWAIFCGWKTGFIIQFSGLLAMFIGVFIAYKASFWLAEEMNEIISTDPIIINTIAFIITFFVAWFLVVLLGKFLNVVVKVAMLGIANRILGIVFAILKAVFAISVILMLVGNLNISFKFLSQKQIDKSMFYRPIEKFAPIIAPYLSRCFDKAQAIWDEHQKRQEK